MDRHFGAMHTEALGYIATSSSTCAAV